MSEWMKWLGVVLLVGGWYVILLILISRFLRFGKDDE
jgi:hypothetical protein